MATHTEAELNSLLGLSYIEGDAIQLARVRTGRNILAHIVNDSGGWGRGFVVNLSRAFRSAEDAYRLWAANGIEAPTSWDVWPRAIFELGETQFVRVSPNLVVANMCAQHGYGTPEDPIPVRYDAVEQCMQTVFYECAENNAVLHMPRIGTNLGGGTWPEILSSMWDAHVQVGRWAGERVVYNYRGPN